MNQSSELVHLGYEYLWGWRLYNLFGQLIPIDCCTNKDGSNYCCMNFDFGQINTWMIGLFLFLQGYSVVPLGCFSCSNGKLFIILLPFSSLEFLTKFQTKWIFCCPATWRVYLASWFFCWKWGLCWLYCKYYSSFGLCALFSVGCI